MEEQDLIGQIGGPERVHEIVTGMYARIFADPDLSHFFENVDRDRLAKMQLEFILSALGGPVSRSSRELHAIHWPLKISPSQFTAFVHHFLDAMLAMGVAQNVADAAMSELATYRDRIIGDSNVDG
ncbi:MAG: group 1 truncated hemoglobin [Pirellulaceae bacterium]